MRRLAIMLFVALVAILTAAASASAQTTSPFSDYRQAAGNQYGGNPPASPPGQPPDRPPDTPPEEPPGPPEGRPPGGGGGSAPGNAQGGQGQGQGGGAGAGAAATDSSLNLIFLSPVDPAIVAGVNNVLRRLGEPRARVLSLIEPLNIAGIAAASAGTRYSEISERRLGILRALGRDLATEIIRPSPFLARLGPVLMTGDGPFNGQKYFVLARSGGTLATRAATRARNAFETGLAQGARKLRIRGIEIDGQRRKIPLAGVETTQTDPSQIRWYKKRKIPSVDNVDTVNGQRALYEILRLRAKGHYGVKDTADRLLPKGIEADNTAATVDGETETGLGAGMAIGILVLMGAFTTLTALSRVRRSSRRSAG